MKFLFSYIAIKLASSQFPNMTSKLGDMCRYREVDSQDVKFISKFLS